MIITGCAGFPKILTIKNHETGDKRNVTLSLRGERWRNAGRGRVAYTCCTFHAEQSHVSRQHDSGFTLFVVRDAAGHVWEKHDVHGWQSKSHAGYRQEFGAHDDSCNNAENDAR